MSAALNDNRRRDMAIECKRCGGPTMPETVIKLRRGLLGFHETRWQGGYCATCRLSALAKLGCLPVSDRPRRPRRVDAVRRDRRVALSNAVDPENSSIRINMTDRLVPRMPPDGGIAGRLSGRLLDLADQVRRLDPAGRHDPEQFWRDKTELAGQIAALAWDARERLG
jgi:hypothetical protein